MEKSIKELGVYLRAQFSLDDIDIRTYSPLTLAYIGDGIYELVIRTLLVEKKNMPTDKLHRHASSIVKAETQALMAEELRDVLTEEELAVYKRGRNAKTVSRAKNASMSEYRRATGFEALMGYLYLTDQMERIIDLVKLGIEKTGVEL